MKKEALYVVGEIGWEYNDNNYDFRGHSDPIIAFKSKEKADACAEEKNLNNFESLILSGDIRDYGSYCVDDLVSLHKANAKKIFQKIFGCDANYWYDNRDVVPIIIPTKKDYKELYDCFVINWYYVTEISVKG